MKRVISVLLLIATALLAACSTAQSGTSVSDAAGPIVEVYRSPT